MSDLIVIACIGLGTFALRAMFLVKRRDTGPTRGAATLELVAPAVLAAITLPALVAPRGTISLAEVLPSLAAATVSAVVWRRTRGFPQALMAGLVSWWLLLALLPGT